MFTHSCSTATLDDSLLVDAFRRRRTRWCGTANVLRKPTTRQRGWRCTSPCATPRYARYEGKAKNCSKCYLHQFNCIIILTHAHPQTLSLTPPQTTTPTHPPPEISSHNSPPPTIYSSLDTAAQSFSPVIIDTSQSHHSTIHQICAFSHAVTYTATLSYHP